MAQTSYYQASVYFRSGVQRNITATDTSATVTASDIQAVLNKYHITSSYVYPAFPKFKESDTLKISVSDGGIADSLKQMDKAKVFTITVSDTTTRNNLINNLLALSEVLFAEANGNNKSAIIPNDQYFPNQWALNNTSYPGDDIHAESAWDIFTGNPNSIIAIIDEGVDVLHQDLTAKIAGGDNSYSIETSGSLSTSHGTLVAGIAAASSNNGIGISGVDWKAKIISKDKHDYWDCFCTNYLTKLHGDVLINTKINEAVDFSPNVWTLNNSWDLDPANRYSVIVREAFAYAYKNNRVSCVATGNSGSNVPVNYPAGFNTGLIAVGQTDNQDNIAPTSWGSYMDVVAPGQNIYTTNFNNSYIYDDGTSLATPFVSGVASLLKGYNTNLNNDDIEQVIKLSADYKGTTPPYDQLYGYGRINAFKALKLLQAPYHLQQLITTPGGTAYSASGNIKLIMLGVRKLSDAPYIGKRIEVRQTVNLPTNYCSITSVWGTGINTTGYRDNGAYCYGEGFCEVVPGSQTATQVTLRTYVYQLYDILGNTLGYFPRAPGYVVFSYSILGIPQPSINGDARVCATSNPYTIGNLPVGSSVTWSSTPANIVVINSPNAPQTTLSQLGIGQITLSALVNNGCGINQNFTANKSSILVGSPSIAITNTPSGSCNGTKQTYLVVANPSSGGTNWHWTAGTLTPGSIIYIYSPTASSTFVDVTGGGPLNLSYTDLCGNLQTNGITVYSTCHAGQFIVAPNPASGMVNVSTTTATANLQSEAASKTVSQSKIYQIKVLGQTGNVLKLFSYSSGVAAANIDLSSLQNGSYILQIYDNVSWTSQQVVIMK
jgi:hypothetical protein